jgi:hypothetical protein
MIHWEGAESHASPYSSRDALLLSALPFVSQTLHTHGPIQSVNASSTDAVLREWLMPQND